MSLIKISLYINDKPVDEFSRIAPTSSAPSIAKELVEKLKEVSLTDLINNLIGDSSTTIRGRDTS